MSADTNSESFTDREWIVHLLGKEIAGMARIASHERVHPGVDPDKMDYIIESGSKAVISLRRIRQELETLFYGEIREND